MAGNVSRSDRNGVVSLQGIITFDALHLNVNANVNCNALRVCERLTRTAYANAYVIARALSMNTSAARNTRAHRTAETRARLLSYAFSRQSQARMILAFLIEGIYIYSERTREATRLPQASPASSRVSATERRRERERGRERHSLFGTRGLYALLNTRSPTY